MKKLIKGQGAVMKSKDHRFGFCTRMLSLFLVFTFFLQMSNLGYVLAEDNYDPYGAEPGGAQWYQENASAIANGEFSQLPTPSATASSYIPNLVDFTTGYNAAGGTDSSFNSQINNMFGSSANFATAGAGATFATDAIYNDPYGAEPGGALWYQENASAIANGEFSQLPTPSATASSYIPNLVDFTSSYNAMGGTDMGFNNQINDLFATGNQINALAGNDLTGGASFFNIAPETTPHLESPDLATILAQSEDISAGRDTLGKDLLGVPADADAIYNDPYGAEPGGALWYQENASAIANGEFSQLPTPSATASSYIPGLVDFTTGYNASGGTDPGFNSQINLFATPLELKPLDDIIGPALINPATGQDIITSAANSSKGLEFTTPLNTTSVTVPKIEGPALFDLKTGQYVTDSAETIKGPDLVAPANAPQPVTPDTTGQRGYAYMDTNTVFNESVDPTSDFYEYAQQDIKEAYNDKSNIFHTDVVEMINQVNADPVKVRKAADEIIGRAEKYYDQSGRGPWQDAARTKLNPGKNYSNSPLLNNPLTADVNSAVAAEILNRANTASGLPVPKFEMPDIDVPIVEAALLTEPPKVITGAGLEDVVGAPGPDNQIPEVDPAKIQLPAGPTPAPAIQDAGAIAEEILGGAAKGAVIEPPKLPELKPRDVEIPRQAVEPPALNSPREGLGLPEILNPTPGPAADLQRQPAEPPKPPHIVGDAGQIAAQVLGAGPQIQPVLPTPVRNTDETVGRLLPQTTPVPTIPRADLSPRLGAMAITDGTEPGGAMTPAQARFQANMAARQFATGVHMQAAQPTYSYGSNSGSQVQYNRGEVGTAVQGIRGMGEEAARYAERMQGPRVPTSSENAHALVQRFVDSVGINPANMGPETAENLSRLQNTQGPMRDQVIAGLKAHDARTGTRFADLVPPATVSPGAAATGVPETPRLTQADVNASLLRIGDAMSGVAEEAGRNVRATARAQDRLTVSQAEDRTVHDLEREYGSDWPRVANDIAGTVKDWGPQNAEYARHLAWRAGAETWKQYYSPTPQYAQKNPGGTMDDQTRSEIEAAAGKYLDRLESIHGGDAAGIRDAITRDVGRGGSSPVADTHLLSALDQRSGKPLAERSSAFFGRDARDSASGKAFMDYQDAVYKAVQRNPDYLAHTGMTTSSKIQTRVGRDSYANNLFRDAYSENRPSYSGTSSPTVTTPPAATPSAEPRFRPRNPSNPTPSPSDSSSIGIPQAFGGGPQADFDSFIELFTSTESPAADTRPSISDVRSAQAAGDTTVYEGPMASAWSQPNQYGYTRADGGQGVADLYYHNREIQKLKISDPAAYERIRSQYAGNPDAYQHLPVSTRSHLNLQLPQGYTEPTRYEDKYLDSGHVHSVGREYHREFITQDGKYNAPYVW